jgi:hypothetical protein
MLKVQLSGLHIQDQGVYCLKSYETNGFLEKTNVLQYHGGTVPGNTKGRGILYTEHFLPCIIYESSFYI